MAVDVIKEPFYQNWWYEVETASGGIEKREAMHRYIMRAVGALQRVTEYTCDLAGGSFVMLEIRTITGSSYFGKGTEMRICFPPGRDKVPEVVIVNNLGALEFHNYAEHLGFWGRLKKAWRDPFESILLKATIYVLVAGFFADTGLGRKISGWFARIGDWADKTTSEWLSSVNSLLIRFDNFVKKVTTTIENPLKALKKRVDEVIDPLLSTVNSTVGFIEKTITTVEKKQGEIINTIERPLITLDREVFGPLSIVRGRLDQQLGTIANFLGRVGIKEGKEVRQWVKDKTDQIDLDLSKNLTRALLFTAKIQAELNNFKDTIFNEIRKPLDRIAPILDAVAEIQEGQTLKDLKLRNEPLQRTLETYPETTYDTLDRGISYTEIGKITFPSPEENTLPEIKVFENMLDRSSENLYVDDEGKAIEKTIGLVGYLTDNEEEIIGKVVKISETVLNTTVKGWDDLYALGLLWSKAVDTGEILDSFLVPSRQWWEIHKDPGEKYLLEYELGIVGIAIGWVWKAEKEGWGYIYDFFTEESKEPGFSFDDTWKAFEGGVLYMAERYWQLESGMIKYNYPLPPIRK